MMKTCSKCETKFRWAKEYVMCHFIDGSRQKYKSKQFHKGLENSNNQYICHFCIMRREKKSTLCGIECRIKNVQNIQRCQNKISAFGNCNKMTCTQHKFRNEYRMIRCCAPVIQSQTKCTARPHKCKRHDH